MTERRRQPVRDWIRDQVESWLLEERESGVPRKQRLTAARIHRLLIAQGGTVSPVAVRRLVSEIKLSQRDPLVYAYLPLGYDAGRDAQVDFFEGVVLDAFGEHSKVFILLVRACYSVRTFAYAAPNQTREALLEGLMRAFEHFWRRLPSAVV